MKITKTFIIAVISIFLNSCGETTTVEHLEEDTLNSIDMLTPAYYQSETDVSFIDEVNQFLEFAQKEVFHHPLQGSSVEIPSFEVRRGFGPGDSAEHHPAVDLHFGNKETNVNLYASYNGYVTTVKGANKYRDYLAITKDVSDDNGVLSGKIVILYAHIDLNLDEADSINLNGKYVSKGDIISKHLYSGTLGGPHLHFEIRYYRADDIGNETFYSYRNTTLSELTEPSTGSWSYGVWNPSVGYGFGNPTSHGLEF